MAGNGIFKYAETRYMKALVPVAWTRIAGLANLAPRVELHYGRLPGWLLSTLYSDAMANPNHEAVYQIAPYGDKMHVYRPSQVNGPSTSCYTSDLEPASVIAEVHSHGTMRAFFSQTDTRDEQGCRFYGVVGCLNSIPEIAIRVGVYGDFWRIPAAVLFTDTGPFLNRRR
ncbi:MAG: Mov34/MPN/PAD-1 family protein [Anaerolineae bacterium]|nr:Mov34/MPN/PAD-1 family protein [Anaerolineae bacterium]